MTCKKYVEDTMGLVFLVIDAYPLVILLFVPV